MAQWRILRKARASAPWRIVYEGPEPSAKCGYRDIYNALKMGGVQLQRPDGTTAVSFYRAAYHPLVKPPLEWPTA